MLPGGGIYSFGLPVAIEETLSYASCDHSSVHSVLEQCDRIFLRIPFPLVAKRFDTDGLVPLRDYRACRYFRWSSEWRDPRAVRFLYVSLDFFQNSLGSFIILWSVVFTFRLFCSPSPPFVLQSITCIAHLSIVTFSTCTFSSRFIPLFHFLNMVWCFSIHLSIQCAFLLAG